MFKNIHEAIIDQETFDIIQKKRVKRIDSLLLISTARCQLVRNELFSFIYPNSYLVSRQN
nr:recombinase family protein [Streptococcus cuniculi]